MSREKLSDYMKRQYVAKNTIISIAGNFDEKEAISKVKKYFSKIKKTRPITKPKVIEKQEKPEVLLHFRQTDQSHLCFGVRAFNLFHPQRYALDLLTVILGGMMSSRLFIEVRAKLGIAYYINTSSEMNPDTGFLFTQAGLDNKNVEKGIFTILKEYKKISEKKVPREELKKAKDYLKGKTTLLLESSDAQASFYATQEILEKKILTLEEIFKKIDKVTREDILKVAREIFKPEKLNLALIGPFKEKINFEKILKI